MPGSGAGQLYSADHELGAIGDRKVADPHKIRCLSTVQKVLISRSFCFTNIPAAAFVMVLIMIGVSPIAMNKGTPAPVRVRSLSVPGSSAERAVIGLRQCFGTRRVSPFMPLRESMFWRRRVGCWHTRRSGRLRRLVQLLGAVVQAVVGRRRGENLPFYIPGQMYRIRPDPLEEGPGIRPPRVKLSGLCGLVHLNETSVVRRLGTFAENLLLSPSSVCGVVTFPQWWEK